MAKRRYQMTSRRVVKWRKEGRGQGTGRRYKPWYTVYDVPSLGEATVFFSPTVQRLVHCLSHGEYQFALQCDWDDSCVDIREQFPLFEPLETDLIARRAGIRPARMNDGGPWVFTTDFLLTRVVDEMYVCEPTTFKYTKQTDEPRVQEKFEIERRYWRYRDRLWRNVNETHIDTVLVTNIQQLYAFADISLLPEPFPDCFARHLHLIPDRLAASPSMPVSAWCAEHDARFRLPSHTSASLLKHLLARKALFTDMRQPRPILSRLTDEIGFYRPGCRPAA